jgi:hypothetical protein
VATTLSESVTAMIMRSLVDMCFSPVYACVLQEVFARQLRSLEPFRELTDDDVRTAIKNSSGVAGKSLTAITCLSARL